MLTFILSAAAGGCTAGSISMVDLDFRQVSSAGNLIGEHPVEHGCWWVDGDRIVVGLGRYRAGVISDLHRKRMDFSLVLEGLPADRSREYQLNSESVRCYVREGAVHHRYRSLHGAATVWREGGDVLRGRFRMLARRESFHILTGWTSTGQVIMVGDFRAREDERRGMALLTSSEADGMERRGESNVQMNESPGPIRVTGPPVKRPDS